MTLNRRIAINTIVSYGRNILALVCGLFTGRWLLMTLGEVDYGLWGLIGGMMGYVTFLNDIFANAISRYYAVAVGQASAETTDKKAGLEECRKWFNAAISVHSVLPIVSLAFAYPIGIWAVRHFLSIPIERVSSCESVWNFVCVSGFITMFNAPFRAMYVAKQYIAELTFYQIGYTIFNIVVVYYMVSHPGDWLAKYSMLVCIGASIPNVLICGRAFICFRECRLRISYMWDWEYIKDILRYAAYRFLAAVSMMLNTNGLPIVVNKFLGPRFNASMSVGTNLAGSMANLANALNGAVGPAIYNAYGAGDRCRMEKLVDYSSKVGTLFFLMFAIPAGLEISQLLDLWLGTPPVHASLICGCVMVAIFTEYVSNGEVIAVYASGRIAGSQIFLSIVCLVGLTLAILFSMFGFGITGICISIVIFKTILMVGRVVFGQIVAGLSVRHWLIGTFLPMVSLILITIAVGYTPQIFVEASFLRIVLTTLACQIAIWMLAWTVVFSKDERSLFKRKIIARFKTTE